MTFWLTLGAGVFIGYWIGIFTAARRLTKAHRDGRVKIEVTQPTA